MALKAIAAFLNLPEIQKLGSSKFKEAVEYLLHPFRVDQFQIAGLNQDLRSE